MSFAGLEKTYEELGPCCTKHCKYAKDNICLQLLMICTKKRWDFNRKLETWYIQ